MKKTMFLIFLLLSLMVCINSLGWAGGVDDVKAGQAALKQSDFDNAIVLCTKAIEINPQDHLSWYCRARVYSIRGEKDKALSNLKRAITLLDFYKDLFKSDDNFKDFWDDEDFKKLTE